MSSVFPLHMDTAGGVAWDLGILLALSASVVFLFLIIPYVHWSAFMNRRAIRSAVRGTLQYVFGRRGQRKVHGWRLFYKMRTQVILRSTKPIPGISRFPVAKLWVDRDAFTRVKKLLRRAKHTIVIQMFIWKDDVIGREIAEILCAAADRGVSVSISKEMVGDMFELRQDFLGTREEQTGVWKKFWNHPNIHVLHETHNDHAKVYIIDDRIILITGMNIADEYVKWHDYMVELRGRGFVDHYLTDGELPGTFGEARLVMNNARRKEIRPVVMDLLESARRSIVIEHSYISDPAVLRTLLRRSREGVRIVIILPNDPDVHHYSNMHAASQLLGDGSKKGISLFQYPQMAHGKIILVDRERAFIGSANLMDSSLDDMGEVNVLLEGTTHHKAVRKLRDLLREDILRSTPISRPPRFIWLWRWLTWFRL